MFAESSHIGGQNVTHAGYYLGRTQYINVLGAGAGPNFPPLPS